MYVHELPALVTALFMFFFCHVTRRPGFIFIAWGLWLKCSTRGQRQHIYIKMKIKRRRHKITRQEKENNVDWCCSAARPLSAAAESRLKYHGDSARRCREVALFTAPGHHGNVSSTYEESKPECPLTPSLCTRGADGKKTTKISYFTHSFVTGSGCAN